MSQYEKCYIPFEREIEEENETKFTLLSFFFFFFFFFFLYNEYLST